MADGTILRDNFCGASREAEPQGNPETTCVSNPRPSLPYSVQHILLRTHWARRLLDYPALHHRLHHSQDRQLRPLRKADHREPRRRGEGEKEPACSGDYYEPLHCSDRVDEVLDGQLSVRAEAADLGNDVAYDEGLDSRGDAEPSGSVEEYVEQNKED